MKKILSLAVVGAVAATLGSLHAQSGTARARSIAIVSNAAGAAADSNGAVDRMVRDGALRSRLDRADTLLRGRHVEQLVQYYRGVRVWGGGVSRQSEGARTESVFGRVYDGLDLDTTPTLDRDAAVAALARAGTPLNAPNDPELAVVPSGDGTAVLAWIGEVMAHDDVLRLFVDAKTGAVLRHYSMLQRQAPAAAIGQGSGVLGDTKKVSATPMSGTFVASDPLRPPAIKTFDMHGDLDRAYAVLINEVALAPSDLASNSANNWTDGAVVDAHAYSAYTYDYYYKRFGRHGLDDANHPIVNMVHTVKRNDIFTAPPSVLGTFYLNAFYCGECGGGMMTYGEGLPGGVYMADSGQRFDFFSGALDIVAHELTHGVTDFSSQLEYVDESGALNESFSDMMGTSVEFFFQPPGTGQMKADYLLGEDIVVGVRTGALNGIRSMADPALYGQPDHYRNRAILPPDEDHDNGGVHVNSGIPNHVYFLAIEGGTNRTSGIRVQGVGAANRAQIEKVFYRAFAQLMPSNADFSMARAVTLQAAQDLYGVGSAPYNAVRDAWTAVGVN